MALKGTLTATAILLVFALFGEAVLRLFGISLPALLVEGENVLLRTPRHVAERKRAQQTVGSISRPAGTRSC
jgi:small neutral amino acid transporter SnatA (MarC family)